MQEPRTALTFETFIEKAKDEIRIGKSFTGVIVFCEKDEWFNFEDVIPRFNSIKRRWKVDIINTFQDDFLIIRFKDSVGDEGDKHFFIKTNNDGRYINLLVLSFEGYHGFEIFKSLIRYAKSIWLGWVGSVFLERFDTFLKMMYQDNKLRQDEEIQEEYDIVWDKFNIIVEGKKPKKTGTIRHASKEDFLTLRNHYKNQKQVLYLQKTTYKIVSNGNVIFKISLSDRTEFTLERGNIIVFLNLFREILDKSRQERDLFTKTNSIKKYEQRIDTTDEPVEIVNFEIDKIEMIELDISNPISSSWFQNLVRIFSAGYLKDYNLISSVIEEGNPYF